MTSRTFNLCLLGFGHVNRTLVELLLLKKAALHRDFGIEWRITGVASRRLGWRADSRGFEPTQLCGESGAAQAALEHGERYGNVREWLEAARANVMFEATSLNVETGEPAIGHIRTALEHGAHAVTANKGPIVHAYRELRDLAAGRGRQFLFESTVMDGAPIFSMFRDSLPTAEVKGFCGILNSTTNVILSGMEDGMTFEESLRKAQELGIAETDPSYDIDGWDAAVKVAALVNVIMDVPLKPQTVARDGIRQLTADTVRAARAAGRPYKLVCRAKRVGASAGVEASVRPEHVDAGDPMSLVAGTSSIVRFETDIFPGLTITEQDPGLHATAYGVLADFVRAAGS